MKTQTKIIFFLTSVFIIYLLLFSGFVYYALNNYAYSDFYKRLEIRAATAAKIELENRADIDAVREIQQEFLEELPEEQIIIIDPDDYLGDNYDSWEFPRDFYEEILENQSATYNNGNIYYSGILYSAGNKNYVVIASAENYYSTHHALYLRNILLLGLVASVLIILLISWMFSRKVLKPIENIVKRMQGISTESLNRRLPTPRNEELASITTSFNEMLNRLETSFETQKNFISNASHELNTPLTSIIGQAEIAISQARSQEYYQKTLSDILEDAENLKSKIEALLSFAQTSYTANRQMFEEIRIDELLIDVKDNLLKLYPEAKIHIDFSLIPDNPDKLKFKGNRQLLNLAFFNILMNASKYSQHQKVKVAIGVSNQNIVVVVKDQGIGIPPDELKHIYDPFFRASNTHPFKGYGIGLPLSRNIFKIHQGKLLVSSDGKNGTTVEVRIPINLA
ncbi:HAMP domain-containing sensor histidine kinase [Salegentibacter sp. HM20]